MNSIPLEKLIKDMCEIFHFTSYEFISYEGLLETLKKCSDVSFKLANGFMEISDIVDQVKEECFTTIEEIEEEKDND